MTYIPHNARTEANEYVVCVDTSPTIGPGVLLAKLTDAVEGIDGIYVRSVQGAEPRIDQPTVSLKFDEGKMPLDLISPYFKDAIAEVLAFGEKKYGRWNWMKSGFKVSRLRAALDRHLSAFDKREDLDDETQLFHLAHAACMLMFLIHQQMLSDVYGHLDDRPNFQTKELPNA